MTKKNLLFICFLFVTLFANSQIITKIYDIQGSGETSEYYNEYINTEGVVTLTLFGENQLNGFFLQDTLGDNNPATSDGIFVYGLQNVQQGDYISLRAKVTEYYGKTELTNVSNLQILFQNISLPYINLNFPTDFDNYEKYEGMVFCLNQTMVITSTSQLKNHGELIISSKRLREPTDVALPLSDSAIETLEQNDIDYIYLDDGSNSYNPIPTPFLDENSTRRTGGKIDNLKCVLDYVNSYWVLYPIENFSIYGNERTNFPVEPGVSYDLKICGFNVENFLDESELQKIRIVKTLKAINADIFGLCEIKQGQQYIETLVNALNESIGENTYSYINTNQNPSTYTTTQIIYKHDAVTPFRDFYIINSSGPMNRKINQGFFINNSNDNFILSVNHLKAKSGTGTGLDADQNDGQGIFNYTRTQEAHAVVETLENLKEYFETDKILIVGDLNSFAKEDPIEIFREAGYENQLTKFHENEYSYCFGNAVEYLDYALANEQMEEKIAFANVWHINADEAHFLDYQECNEEQDFLFRSSDHDPIIVYLNFNSQINIVNSNLNIFKIFPNPASSTISLQLSENIKQLEIFNITGKIVDSIYYFNSKEINISNLQKGVYFVKILTESNKYYLQKFVKL
ncbi:MAG: ExeM/NucH family extracellular endonuclease [Bacteroidales bacterium]|jgi:predicted extracellular nuclease|nr:ExeM/NucH family extracellular endonuclease [Bacteroidales bacterium]